jgi:hypothetical protein
MRCLTPPPPPSASAPPPAVAEVAAAAATAARVMRLSRAGHPGDHCPVPAAAAAAVVLDCDAAHQLPSALCE